MFCAFVGMRVFMRACLCEN